MSASWSACDGEFRIRLVWRLRPRTREHRPRIIGASPRPRQLERRTTRQSHPLPALPTKQKKWSVQLRHGAFTNPVSRKLRRHRDTERCSKETALRKRVHQSWFKEGALLQRLKPRLEDAQFTESPSSIRPRSRRGMWSGSMNVQKPVSETRRHFEEFGR